MGLSLPAGYGHLSLRVMGVLPAGYGCSSCGLWTFSPAGYGHLYPAGYWRSPCGLRASLRVAGLALSTDYGCGSANTASLTRASTGGWRHSHYSCGSASTVTLARLPPCSLWALLVYHAACYVCNALSCSAYSANNRVIQQNSPAN
jgi:hypothetical protein